MTYRLGILDKSPLSPGEKPAAALARTLRLAKRVEEAGYARFWVAEHHNNAALASSSPEVLIAHLLAHTKHIRVGAGGVMLQHYAPYKVAENFNLLATLAPGRVDLGVGQAPGGFPLSTQALQIARESDKWPDVATKVAQLTPLLEPIDDNATALAGGLQATPVPEVRVGRYILGGSAASARLAAGNGWGFVYAGHFNADYERLSETLKAYRAAGGKDALLALSIIVAENPAQAARYAAELEYFRLEFSDGLAVNLGSREQVDAFVSEREAVTASASRFRIETRQPYVLHGSASAVLAALEDLHQTLGVAEFLIDTPLSEAKAREASVTLLAEHFQHHTKQNPTLIDSPEHQGQGVDA